MKYHNRGVTDAVCPYYHCESRYSITCEGIEDGTEVLTRFPDSDARDRWVQEQCCRFRRTCPVAKLLDEKYEDK